MLEHQTAQAPQSPEKDYADLIARHPGIRKAIDEVARVRDLRTRDKNLPPFKQVKYSDIDGFVGHGEEKLVFAVDDYAVKILHEYQQTGFNTDRQIQALEAGKGVDGLEQLVAADAKEDVIVTTLAKGKSLPALSSWALRKGLRPEHIEKLSQTLKEMEERGLHYDNAGNVLFDPEGGFTIVDYRYLGEGDYYKDVHAKDLELKAFLDHVLSLRKITMKGRYDSHGELLPDLRPRKLLGGVALLAASRRRYRKAKSNLSHN